SLEPVDDIARRLRVVERFELLGNGVQASHGAAIVVLIVALDELQREAAQRPRTAVDLLQLIAHDNTSKHKLNLRRDGSRTIDVVPESVTRRSQDWTGHR